MNRETLELIYKLRDELSASDPELKTASVTRDDLTKLLSNLFFIGDEWSDQSALGYAISAAERIEMSGENIKELVREMYQEFDLQTLDSAASVYRESNY